MPVIYEPPINHRCWLPKLEDYRIGTLYACHECPQVWELSDELYGRYWKAKFLSKRLRRKYGI